MIKLMDFDENYGAICVDGQVRPEGGRWGLGAPSGHMIAGQQTATDGVACSSSFSGQSAHSPSHPLPCLPQKVRTGYRLKLVLRDPEGIRADLGDRLLRLKREDLAAVLAGRPRAQAVGGLLFVDLERGAALHGEAGYEAGRVGAFLPVPLAGMFAAGEQRAQGARAAGVTPCVRSRSSAGRRLCFVDGWMDGRAASCTAAHVCDMRTRAGCVPTLLLVPGHTV